MNSLTLARPSPPAVAQHFAAVSPRLLARVAGVLYLLIFIVAPSGAATATPLRMAVTTVCDAGVAFIFYALFKPVSRNLSMLALLFRLMFVAIMTLDSLNYFGAVDLFHSAHSAQVFDTVDRLSLVPFGVHCVLIGYLIYRSGFLARFLGVGMALAGVTYVNFVYPWLVHVAFPYILIPGGVGEGLLTLWLLGAAVDSERWAEKAGAVRGPTVASGGNAK
ncbi:MAG: DUF4386 domain-containing protein [Steroidobacteraceae bacterium]